MHELSVCQALIRQVDSLAQDYHARAVTRILVQNGPLSGVDGHQLKQAFQIARSGSIAARANLEVEPPPLQVRCLDCGEETGALPNALVCGGCKGYRTIVISGDELLLVTVDLETDEEINREKLDV
jgi:hydrogenase nickel incorporation protein HypA/HybF